MALREKPGSGLELTRRFEKSFGFFWHATHQQIYRVLGRMVDSGELTVEVVGQAGRPDKKVYRVTPVGERALADWLATPAPMEQFRSDLAVRMRGASYGDRAAILDVLRSHLVDHRVRLEHYLQLEKEYGTEPDALDEQTRDQYLVLRGGIRLEQFWIGWVGDYLRAHGDDPTTTTQGETP